MTQQKKLFFLIFTLFSKNHYSQVSIDSDINHMAMLDFLKKY